MLISESPLVLVAMSFSFGAFIATCFASAISLAETKVAVTGAITSKFVFGAAVGWMTLPFLTGYLFDKNQIRLDFCLQPSFLKYSRKSNLVTSIVVTFGEEK